MKTIGEIFRQGRLEERLSLRELAQLVGKSPSTIHLIETNALIPSEDTLTEICKHLDFDEDLFLCWTGRLPKRFIRLIKERPYKVIAALEKLEREQ